MKKSLIALAALAAAGVASAQVTLYGVADVSLSKASNSSFQMSGNGDLNNGNSRLGVKGSEDLGGGLTAAFQFEQAVNLENGGSDAAAFQRTAKVSLAGSFGTLHLGRSLSPTFYGLGAWELTGMANYSAVVAQFGFVGSSSGPRNNSAITYQTPQMGAVSAQIGYVNKADNANNAKMDLNVVYAAGDVTAALIYHKATNDASANYALGGRYNMGAFSVAGSIQNPSGAARGITIGAAAKLDGTNLVFDIARDNGSAVKSTSYVFEANRSLSKRTLAYFAVLRKGGATAVTTTGAGLRHNF